MIVVAILSVLAVLAVHFYGRHVKRGKTVEALNFLSQIRLKQESYFQAYGVYANIEEWNPAHVGANRVSWTSVDDDVNNNWRSLGVRPEFPMVYYRYRTCAGPPGDDGGNACAGGVTVSKVNTNKHWWLAQASGDLDGDGDDPDDAAGNVKVSFFEIHSDRSVPYVLRAVE